MCIKAKNDTKCTKTEKVETRPIGSNIWLQCISIVKKI